MKNAISLFYSYSHQDEAYRNKLETYLSTLRREQVIAEWHDRKIIPGQQWADQIDQHLETADIILLLISPDFIASDYCYEIEMNRALERQSKGLAEVVAIIIRPSDWQHSPFAHLQALPKDGKPVTTWGNEDEAYLDIALGIRKTIEAMQANFADKPSKVTFNPNHPLRTEYLLRMASEWRDLPLRALASRASDPTGNTPPMDLEQVYTELDTTSPRHSHRGQLSQDSQERNQPLTATEALAEVKGRRMVLLGQPGSGKSTFGRYLALKLAEHLRDPATKPLQQSLPTWTADPLLPVFVSLRRLSSYDAGPNAGVRGTGLALAGFIQSEVDGKDGLQGFGPSLLAELEQLGGLVIFDGLDEVAAIHREWVKQALADFALRYLRCRVLVTCRVHSYKLDSTWQLGWETHELADFSTDRINGFINAWFTALGRINPTEQATCDRKAKTLIDALGPNDPRGLRELAGKPLLLTVMAIVHNYKALPGSRVGVYRECVDILLQRWEANKGGASGSNPLLALAGDGLSIANIHDALHEIAFKAQEASVLGGRGQQAVVAGSLIHSVIAEYLREAEGVERFMEHCRHANGLLLLDAVEVKRNKILETYRFPHLTFQEYLAALHFNTRDDDVDGVEDAVEKAGDPSWWEVVRFFGEYLCYDETCNARAKDITDLLQGLCPEEAQTDNAYWRRVWLAGLLLPGWESRVKEKNRPENLKPRIIQSLVELVESPTALHTEPAARAAVGRLLGQLGDPRPGVGVKDGLPDILWVRIPGTGPQGCKLGTGAKPNENAPSDAQWPEDKPPIVIESFALAAYPVTVTQYECFVLAGGYDNPRYWSQAGWEQSGKRNQAPKYWQDQKWHQANHPVVGVSAWEAEAFCRWLSEQCGQEVRLPTEAEWEWAARGPDGLIYPWGEVWDASRANTGETQIDRTTAVGLYPMGAADGWKQSGGEGKVYDLAGNVFEWTASAYSKDYALAHETAKDDNAYRVARGGSWLYSPDDARADYRILCFPGYRDDFWGFRVLSVVPINTDR